MIFKDKYIYCVLWPFSVMSSKAYTYINGTSGYFFNGTFFMFWVKLWGNMKICATWNTSSGSIQKRHLEESTIKEYSRNPKDFFFTFKYVFVYESFLGIVILIRFFSFFLIVIFIVLWSESDQIPSWKWRLFLLSCGYLISQFAIPLPKQHKKCISFLSFFFFLAKAHQIIILIPALLPNV